MNLYNTRTREIEQFQPINDRLVTIYTCGPTVYDYQHIGNYFGYIHWDILLRVLQNKGYQVNRVMNITDVGHLVSDADEGEDKLEKGAAREGKTAWEIAEFYTRDFQKSMVSLNTVTPKYVAATKHIDDQIELIKRLEDAAFTYIIDDGVYFDTAKFPKYTEFARIDITGQKEGARVDANLQKRNPADFALWKFSPKGKKRDMQWDSPWGKGFPGWHIECSAMAMKYLGETIDIHTGGIDHIPIHHTNEIAQSEAATGKQFAVYWLHNNHLLVDNAKISKSTGNGYTLADLDKRGYSPMEYKLFVLQSHYRSQSHFSWDNLSAAQSRLKQWQASADLRFQVLTDNSLVGEGDEAEALARAKHELIKALEDDLNTPQALSIIDSAFDATSSGITSYSEQYFIDFLQAIDALLGLELLKSDDITNDQKELIAIRRKARAAKDWNKSDKLRSDLEVEGLGVRDTDNNTLWFRL